MSRPTPFTRRQRLTADALNRAVDDRTRFNSADGYIETSRLGDKQSFKLNVDKLLERIPKSASLPLGQYQSMVFQMVTQNQVGADWLTATALL